MDETLTHADSLSVGIWLQMLILELTEKVLCTNIEGSVSGHPQVVSQRHTWGEMH